MRLAAETNLSEILTVENSPILFGCRTGLCGTCMVEVEVMSGTLPPPEPDEAETLRMLCPGNTKARLTCQLKLKADIKLEPIKS